MIKEVKKFQIDDNRWSDFDTPESAKEQERRKVIEKFLRIYSDDDVEIHDWYSYDVDSIWGKNNRKKAKDMKSESFKRGVRSGKQQAVRDLMKFYPEIIDALKKIDNQKIEEVKNA